MENNLQLLDEKEKSVKHLFSPAVCNPCIHLATAPATRKAYRSDIHHYESWGGKLPATTDMIASYLQHFAALLNPRTLSRRLVALKHWHTYQGFPDPTTHPAIKKIMTGILRAHGKPKEKARPFLPEELAQIHAYLSTDNTLTHLRDDALLLHAIMRAGRWKQTNTVVEYIETNERVTENAAANVLQKMVATHSE